MHGDIWCVLWGASVQNPRDSDMPDRRTLIVVAVHKRSENHRTRYSGAIKIYHFITYQTQSTCIIRGGYDYKVINECRNN